MKRFLVPALVLVFALGLAGTAAASNANTGIEDADMMSPEWEKDYGNCDIDAGFPLDVAGYGVQWQATPTIMSGEIKIGISDDFSIADIYGFPVIPVGGGNFADWTGYTHYKLLVTNNSPSDWVYAKAYYTTGSIGYWHDAAEWLAPGESKLLSVDLSLPGFDFNGGAPEPGAPDLATVSNFGFELSSEYGTGDYEAEHFDVTVATLGDATVSVMPAISGPINCSESSTLDFVFMPGPSTNSLRGYEVTFTAGPELFFEAGDIADSGVLAGIGPHLFQVVDNGDGSFTVADAVLGSTDGLYWIDSFFDVTFHGAGTGDGDVQILDLTLRDLDNIGIPASSLDGLVLVDCTPPNIPTMTPEPTYTLGITNTVAWTSESASGATHYEVEAATNSGFTGTTASSGWITGLSHSFTNLTDGQIYYYHVRSRDISMNVSSYSTAVSSTQDDSTPITSADPLTSYVNAGTFDVFWTGADDIPAAGGYSGLASVKLWFLPPGGVWTDYGDFTASPISFTAGAEGAYEFYTVGTDVVGNVEEVPGTPDASTIVDLTPPTGAMVINDDAPYTTTINVNLDSEAADDNGPLVMRWSNDNTNWSDWEPFAEDWPWTIPDIPDTIVVWGEFRDPALNIFGVMDSIIYDPDPPEAVPGFWLDPKWEHILIYWTPITDDDMAGIAVYRGLWHDGSGGTAYPEYDDWATDKVPDRPATRAAAEASSEWVLAGLADPTTGVFDDPIDAPRGVYYYELFPFDAAGNDGPPTAETQRTLNYWLGDVAHDDDGCGFYDGYVNTADITCLGSVYGLVDGMGGYDPEHDIGPTDDFSSTGIPLTDNVIGFEDLMIFALNYGDVEPRLEPAEGLAEANLSWSRVADDTWALALLDPCSDLKGIRLQSEDAGSAALAATAGSLLGQQGGPCFLRSLENGVLDVSLALMGRELTIVGAGELFRVEFPSGVQPGDLHVTARSSTNETVAVNLENSAAPELPTSYALASNYPNPFNPKTTLRFELPAQQPVKLTVFAADGRRIITLVDEVLPAGYHSADWTGRDARGERVASGVYFYRIDAGPLQETRKMLLLK